MNNTVKLRHHQLMKNYLLTLGALFCLVVVTANAAYAKKKHPHHSASRHKHHSQGYVNLHPIFVSPDQLPHYAASSDSVTADTLLQFARMLIGVPYRPATSNPLEGFDCSGFVSFVFKNFNFTVPRSSREFAGVGERVTLDEAKPGDVILFTGTERHARGIGHVGIVLCNENGEVKFIHSTSGKEYCVTITSMDDTYRRRFVQIVRLLKTNDDPVLAAAK